MLSQNAHTQGEQQERIKKFCGENGCVSDFWRFVCWHAAERKGTNWTARPDHQLVSWFTLTKATRKGVCITPIFLSKYCCPLQRVRRRLLARGVVQTVRVFREPIIMSLAVGGETSLSTDDMLLSELGTSSLTATSSCRPFLKTKFQVFLPSIAALPLCLNNHAAVVVPVDYNFAC